MTFNPLTAIIDADKTWPESVSLPDALEDASPVQLAEARFRFSRLAQVAGALRRVVDDELADRLQAGALRYGNDIIRANNGRGSAKVIDSETWWDYVARGITKLNPEGCAALLSALYPADSVRLTGLRVLAETIGVEEQTLRDTFITYGPSSASVSVMPRDRAPKWTQQLEEGETTFDRPKPRTKEEIATEIETTRERIRPLLDVLDEIEGSVDGSTET